MNHLSKILAITAIASMTLAAQEPPPRSPDKTAPAETPGANRPARPLPRFDRGGLELTPEQRTKLDEVNKSYTTTATPLFARLSTARRELEALVNQDKFDEAAMRAKAKEMADLEADLAIARAIRYSKFRAFLTPEQARRFNTPTPMARPFLPVLHEGQTPPPIAPNK